ncbi:MAG: hypothetical protein WKH64_08385 [Chloroflexia bacterium]
MTSRVVRENERRRLLEQRYLEEYRAAHPDAPRVILTREQKAEIKRTPVSVKPRVDAESVGMLGADILEASKIDAEKNYRSRRRQWRTTAHRQPERDCTRRRQSSYSTRCA